MMEFNKATHKDTHVYVLYSDGELALTKGGDLFGSRSDHMQEAPVCPENIVPEDLAKLFTDIYNGYPCIILDERKQADEYRTLLANSIDRDKIAAEQMEYLAAHVEHHSMETARQLLALADSKDYDTIADLYNMRKANARDLINIIDMRKGNGFDERIEGIKMVGITWDAIYAIDKLIKESKDEIQ